MTLKPDYEAIYRAANPPVILGCPFGKPRGLHDLWPADQEAFKRVVDATLAPAPRE